MGFLRFCSINLTQCAIYILHQFLKISGPQMIPVLGLQGCYRYFILFYFLREWESFQQDFRRRSRTNINEKVLVGFFHLKAHL